MFCIIVMLCQYKRCRRSQGECDVLMLCLCSSETQLLTTNTCGWCHGLNTHDSLQEHDASSVCSSLLRCTGTDGERVCSVIKKLNRSCFLMSSISVLQTGASTLTITSHYNQQQPVIDTHLTQSFPRVTLTSSQFHKHSSYNQVWRNWLE